MWKWILTLPFIALLTGCVGANAYHRGNDAYEYGAYKIAFANYLYAANEGIVPAQYAVGYQYYYGQGTKLDQAKGIMWLKRAAPHSPRARYALHLIDENKPLQPWLFQLQKPTHATINHHDNPIYTTDKACKISVICSESTH